MPRRAEIQVRELDPDPVYSSKLVSQVINKVMNRGKKSTAEQIVYRALDMVGDKTGKPPVEILDALNQQGGAFKRKDDLYRMAQANKAFAHYRW